MTALFLATLVSLIGITPEVQVQSLTVDDDIWDIAVVDINHDGHMDLLVLTCDPDSDPMRKQVHVFLGAAGGRFPDAPSTTLRLPPEASVLFFSGRGHDTPPALMSGDHQGFQPYRFTDGALQAQTKLSIPSIIPDQAREPLFLQNIVRDWTGDGQEEWLLPQTHGYSLFRGEEEVAFIECDVVSQVRQSGSMSVSYHLPEYVVFEIEESANPAIAFLYPEEIEFAYGPDWGQRHRIPIPGNHRDQYRSYTALRDLNGNGLPDLVVTEMEGTVSMDSTTRVYLAQSPFVYPTAPTTTIENRGSIAAPFFYDLDNSGALDALVVSVPFGPRNIMNYFFRKRVRVDVDAYRLVDGQFETRPAYSTSLGMDAPEGRGRPAYTMGDFLGNGLMDVAYAEGADTLAIHYGVAGELINNRPDITVTLPTTMGEVRTQDITGNGGKDILLFHPDSAHSKSVQAITFITE